MLPKSFLKYLVWVIGFLSAWSGVVPVSAKTIYVPQDYESIQKAIDIADRGDTVKVDPGIYYENIILRDGRNLIGSGADKTIITDDGEGRPDAIIQIDGNCELSGFTITGARGAGVGHAVMVTRGAPKITDNIVRDNSYTGIGIHSASVLTTAVVSRNRIYGNGGAGIANLGEYAKAVISDNEIYSNSNVGIACTDFASPVIDNNRIFHNGVGVVSKDGARALIQNNLIQRNKLVGVVSIKQGGGVIRKNEIKENGTLGINVDGQSEVWIIENEITDNGTEGISIKEKSKGYIAYNVMLSYVAIALSVRNSEATIIKNEIYTTSSPGVTLTQEFLESQGIEIDHIEEIMEYGQGVIDLRDSKIAMGGNKLGGGIKKGENTKFVAIPVKDLPSSPDDIPYPTFREASAVDKQVPVQDKYSSEEGASVPALNLPPVPEPKPSRISSGCLGIF